MRVAVVTNAIPDYRYPVFKRLTTASADDWRIFVSLPLERSCAAARRDLPLRHSASFNPEFTTNHDSGNAVQREQLPIPLVLWFQLLRFRPRIIIAGDMGARTLVCWLAAKLLRAQLIVWSEEIATSAAGRGRGQQRLRRWLARRAAAFIAWGRPATSYLIDGLEVQADRVFRCDQAIDNEWWRQRANALDRSQCRAAAGCSGTVFLLVGRLVQRKGFAYFLSAWARLPAELHERAMVVIVGEGEQRAELERLIASHAMRNVRLVGAKPPTELAAYYAAADVFVLPSLEDVWGLVVNEAMCFGLPVLASGQAGSAQELIAGRGCGEVFNPVNVEQFGELLSVWARAVPAYDADHIHSVVSGCSIETSVQGISSAIQYCVSRTARVRSP